MLVGLASSLLGSSLGFLLGSSLLTVSVNIHFFVWAGWEFEFDHRCVCFHVIVVVVFISFVLIFVFGLFHGRSIDDGRGSYQGRQGDEIFGNHLQTLTVTFDAILLLGLTGSRV